MRREPWADPGDTVVLDLPFTGRWLVQNSPADRVPSHGSHAGGETYAIDFVPVDAAGTSAPRTWRAAFATEPPERFVGFGRPVLAPTAGVVVLAHDGEPDHEARRSPLTLVPYLLGQAARVRGGIDAVAGNHVVLALTPDGPFVLLAHLRHDTLGVSRGQTVERGQPLAQCGNSGNSTEPHVHVQVSDSTDWHRARGIPLAFGRPVHLGDPGDPGDPGDRTDATGATWVPRNGDVVDA